MSGINGKTAPDDSTAIDEKGIFQEADVTGSEIRYINRSMCIVGLDYVGLPLAVEFGKKMQVTGYDISKERIKQLKEGHDYTGEVSDSELRMVKIDFTFDPSAISKSNFVIVAVPTPIDEGKKPDLNILKKAAETVDRNLSKGSIIVFESTVYPRVTEDICVPIIEWESGFQYMKDFKVGYPPERINPGDKEHTITGIVKVVSGCDEDSLETIVEVYGSIIKAGVYKAPSIKVAEAAKVIENIQRDINIALMNELKMIFDKIGIETEEVLKAAKTKWNFLNFHPGLVGGHCISVDPYYLAHMATAAGHYPEMILAGRWINDEMAGYGTSRIIKDMIRNDLPIKGARVLVLGAAFKPDVKDLRNSKVEDSVSIRENSCLAIRG
ncbi:MAG: nucleotide sugar dehydrogenase [Deltaproteobacteria bacterium]|nr:nucleotide sugar dehydrogenase [Deltaproteobacteria bacterium]